MCNKIKYLLRLYFSSVTLDITNLAEIVISALLWKRMRIFFLSPGLSFLSYRLLEAFDDIIVSFKDIIVSSVLF